MGGEHYQGNKAKTNGYAREDYAKGGIAMADAPKRPCPKCKRVLIQDPAKFCPTCLAKRKQQTTIHPQLKKKADPFYGLAIWRKVRDAYKARHPLCERCLSKGFTRRVYCVDHILERIDGGAEYDNGNHMSMCRACHAWKTKAMAKARELGIDAIMAFVAELKRLKQGTGGGAGKISTG